MTIVGSRAQIISLTAVVLYLNMFSLAAAKTSFPPSFEICLLKIKKAISSGSQAQAPA